MACAWDNTIRKVTPVGTNWVVTTLAGLAGNYGSADGTGSAARFGRSNAGNGPSGVAVDSAGNLYVADGENHTIRKVTPVGTNWVVTTLAGRAGNAGSADGIGSAARFNSPNEVAVDNTGNVYVADYDNSLIRKMTPVGTNWVVTTLAGLAGDSGSADGTGESARIGGPTGVAVDSAGNVYVADFVNNTISKGSRVPALAITSSGPGFGFNGGQFGFDLTGPAGQLVVIEASTDLVSWLPIWTNTLASPLNYSDPRSGVHSARFYRAHTK